MSIERLVIPGGIPLWGNTSPIKAADRAIETYAGSIQTLTPGDYHLLDEKFRPKNVDLHLTVLENGFGLFQYEDSENRLRPHMIHPDGHIENDTNDDPRLRRLWLPKDTIRIPVMSLHRRKAGPYHLLEVIRWQPENPSMLAAMARVTGEFEIEMR
jgi:hypothetical protein